MARLLLASLLFVAVTAHGQAPVRTRPVDPRGSVLPRQIPQLPNGSAPGRGETVQFRARLPFTRGERTLWVRKIDDEYVYQGDIVVGTTGPRPAFHGTDDRDDRWPNGEIPVRIDPGVNAPDVLEPLYDAMNALMWQTEMRLVPYDARRHRDFVNVRIGSLVAGAAARSWVGRKGGSQDLTISPNFSGPAGTLLHEFLHAAGAYHEQSRPDRDYFVDLDLTGMNDEQKSNFDRIDGDQQGAYDYLSIMHYGPFAFSPSGAHTIFCKTVVVRVPCPTTPVPMGQRDAMSQGDIQGLDALYSEFSRFSEGGWNASLIRDLPATSGTLQGRIRWNSASGQPLAPNFSSGAVDYVQMRVSAPRQVKITWANRKKSRSFTGWRTVGSPTFAPLVRNGDSMELAYAMSVPADVPLRVSFEVIDGRWGQFSPAPNGCGQFMRCGYGLDATASAAGTLMASDGGSASLDFRISGDWSGRPNIDLPKPQIIDIELVKRIIDKKDWVMTPVDSLHRIDVRAIPAHKQLRGRPATR